MNKFNTYLCHGAGAGHNSRFLQLLNTALSKQKNITPIPVTFSYMQEQEITQKKRPPPKIDSLISELTVKIDKKTPCIITGKSMGGRVATQLSSLSTVKGIVCFGFPFYPQGKPDKHRLNFLDNLQAPCLIIQGTRDPLGNLDWVNKQSLPNTVQLVWIEGADHDFKTLKRLNTSIEETIEEIAQITNKWLDAL